MGQRVRVTVNGCSERIFILKQHKLAEQMYKAAGSQAAAGGGPGAGAGPSGSADGNGQAKKDEGVIDAEYVDVEDKK